MLSLSSKLNLDLAAAYLLMPQPYKNKVEIKEKTEEIENLEYPDDWWYRVYLGVVISNIVVILALWSFTKYFSV